MLSNILTQISVQRNTKFPARLPGEIASASRTVTELRCIRSNSH